MAGVDRLTLEELVDSRERWWSDAFTDFVWAAFASESPAAVLELGCGTGVLARKLGSRLRSAYCGVDVDLLRLHVAHANGGTYIGGDGQALPFASESFGVSLTILTLQHIRDVWRTIAELKRVTRAGGLLVSVEPDNLGQRIYLQERAGALDGAFGQFWRRIADRCENDIGIGPRLPAIFRNAGLTDVTLATFLVSNVARTTSAALTERFQQIGARYGVDAGALTGALGGLGNDPDVITTVPIFRVSGRR